MVAIFSLTGLLSGGDNGSNSLTSSMPGESSPTASRTPPPADEPRGTEILTDVKVESFGAPGRTIRGIAWNGTDLWLSGDAELFKVDTSGKVLGAYSSPEVTPEGLIWDGETFWLFTTNYGKIYQFSIDESAPAPEPKVISSFQSPDKSIGMTNDGLAWDGSSLWYSDSYNVYRLDTAGNVLGGFAFGHRVAGLAWDGQRLWLTYDSFPDNATLVKTDTEGNVLLSFSGPVYQIDALTWGDGHLWAAGADSLAGEPMIYRIDVETVEVGLTPTATSMVGPPELGTYSGTTSQARSVELDVVEGGIARIAFEVEGECPGTQQLSCTCESKTETTFTSPQPIAETGFTDVTAKYEFSAVFDSATTASGFVRLNSSGGAEAPCWSEQVTWTASLQ